ncbi:MAG: protease modulator HflC [bacterium]|jgi:membrane protease subunit HflC|nr:protease modulator HflC [bacterium]
MKLGVKIGIAAAGLFLILSAIYQVNETEQVIITQFGRPVGGAVTKAGLHLKVPLIQEVHRFDKRFMAWDGDPNQVPTRDKRFIWIDTYARWRIVDPLLFYQRLRDERGAHSRLDDILDGEARTAVARHDLVELVRTTNRTLISAEDVDSLAGEGAGPINTGRQVISAEILANAQARVKDLGIEVLDIRFKRIGYVEEVRQKVYERMISERRRIADQYRSEGQGEASRINGERERELKTISSEAYRKAEEVRGKADAEATRIYAGAYNQNQQTRDFYTFMRTMESYQESFNGETALILSTSSEFYRFLSRGGR